MISRGPQKRRRRRRRIYSYPAILYPTTLHLICRRYLDVGSHGGGDQNRKEKQQKNQQNTDSLRSIDVGSNGGGGDQKVKKKNHRIM